MSMMKFQRFGRLEALDGTDDTVLVTPQVNRIYQPSLSDDPEAPELLERFLWNRLPEANHHQRRLIFGYARTISPVTANFNPPFTAINWVNTAPNIWSSAGKLSSLHIAQRAVYGNERTTDTRLRPAYAAALLIGRQYLAYKGGEVSGEALPLYGIDTILGGLAARAAYCWTLDKGAHDARQTIKDQERLESFQRIFDFSDANTEQPSNAYASTVATEAYRNLATEPQT